MISIAICDDSSISLEIAAQMCAVAVEKATSRPYKIDLFTSALDLLTKVETDGPYDITLLDIVMPGLTGMEAARDMRSMYSDSILLFITAHDEFALDAFGLHADGYLMKPYDADKFNEAILRCVKRIPVEDEGALTIKSHRRRVKIPYSRIMYTEPSGHNQNIILEDGSVEHVRSSATALFDVLKEDARFFKMGGSHIVNLDKISRVSGQEACLTDGTRLPVPTRSAGALSKALDARTS